MLCPLEWMVFGLFGPYQQAQAALIFDRFCCLAPL